MENAPHWNFEPCPTNYLSPGDVNWTTVTVWDHKHKTKNAAMFVNKSFSFHKLGIDSELTNTNTTNFLFLQENRSTNTRGTIMIRSAMLYSMPKNVRFVSNHLQIRTPSSLYMITRVITKNVLHVMDVERVYKEKNFIWSVKGKSARNVTETMKTKQIIVF